MEVEQDVVYVNEKSESESAKKLLVSKKIAFIVVLLIAVSLVALIVLAAVLGTQVRGSSGSDSNEVLSELDMVNCDVAIVGGGIAGLYTAESLLRLKKETSVCVFERDNRLGGRYYDIRFKEAPDVSVAMGAWRIGSSNTVLRGLVKRFNIKTEALKSPAVIRETRGVTSTKNTEFLQQQQIKQGAFPSLLDTKFANMSVAQMMRYAFETFRAETADQFATFHSYMSYYLADEGAKFVTKVHGFDGLFGNARSLIETFAGFPSVYERPLSGMSAITNALANSTRTLGGKIFINDQVLSIEDTEENKWFIIKSQKRKIKAKKLVVATFPAALKEITGRVARRIQNHRIFQSMNLGLLFKAAAVYNTSWWEKAGNYSLGPMERYFSSSDCLQSIMPYGGKGPHGESVLQMAYNYDGCSRLWGDLYRQLSKPFMDKEMHRALEKLFQMRIPPPLDTAYKYWEEGGWYMPKPGSNVTFKEVENWAKRPLNGEDIFIAGADYSPLRGWSEGALRSVQNVLEEGWK